MRIEGVIWLRDVVDKLAFKHHVETDEVEEVLSRHGEVRRESSMAESKAKNMPNFASLGDLVEFFDTHDLGEYWDQMPEAHFEVDIQRRTHLFALDEELADKLTEVALSKHIPSAVLINSWLREKILAQT